MKYKNRVRSRISNLKDPKNPGLRRNVLAGSIELSRIASMSAEVGTAAAACQPDDELLSPVPPSLYLTLAPLLQISTSLSSCRKWPVMSWSSWGTFSRRRPSGSTKWPKLAAPPLTCCSAASARRRTAPTTRWAGRTDHNKAKQTIRKRNVMTLLLKHDKVPLQWPFSMNLPHHTQLVPFHFFHPCPQTTWAASAVYSSYNHLYVCVCVCVCVYVVF